MSEMAYQAYETLPGNFIIGGDYGNKGTETPESRMILNLKVRQCQPGGGNPTGPEMEISVGITIPQAAWIVLSFFRGLTFWPRKNIWRTFLIRMMKRRWAEMTSLAYKPPQFGESNVMVYPEIL